MKKAIAIMLTLSLVFCFAGCNKKEATEVASTTKAIEQSSTTSNSDAENDETKKNSSAVDTTKSSNTVTGSTATTKSSNSGEHVHLYTTKVKSVAATCTEKGYDVYQCSCGAQTKTNYVNALGHDYFYNIYDGDESRYPKYAGFQGACGLAGDDAATIKAYNYGYCSRCGAKDPQYALCENLVQQGLAYIVTKDSIRTGNNGKIQIDSTVALDNRRCDVTKLTIDELKIAIDEMAYMHAAEYMNLFIYPDTTTGQHRWQIGVCAY